MVKILFSDKMYFFLNGDWMCYFVVYLYTSIVYLITAAYE